MFEGLDVLDIPMGEIRRCLHGLEKGLGNTIHLFVRALGGKNGGDEELKGVSVIQLSLDIRIGSP